ncbi:MAG: DUF4124 domain-containing protein [Gammaproteobacteria bacterium]|nr:DUF4124 domain-containing protein [Gammaproteobacteria bacterium]
MLDSGGGRVVWATLVCLGWLAVGQLVLLEVSAADRIIKCTDPDGKVSFSQTGCSAGVRETIRIENPRIGWVRPHASDRRQHRSVTAEEDLSEREVESGSPSAGVASAQRRRCWRKESGIKRIDSELRHGYKLKRGRELRLQREELQEYLRRFCR